MKTKLYVVIKMESKRSLPGNWDQRNW